MQETIPLFTETEETKKPTFDFADVDAHTFLTSDPEGREYSILMDHHVKGELFMDWLKNKENLVLDTENENAPSHLSYCNDISVTYPGNAKLPFAKNHIVKQNACAIFYIKSKKDLGIRGPHWADDAAREFMENNVQYIPGTRTYVGGSILDKAGDPGDYFVFVYYSEVTPVQ